MLERGMAAFRRIGFSGRHRSVLGHTPAVTRGKSSVYSLPVKTSPSTFNARRHCLCARPPRQRCVSVSYSSCSRSLRNAADAADLSTPPELKGLVDAASTEPPSVDAELATELLMRQLHPDGNGNEKDSTSRPHSERANRIGAPLRPSSRSRVLKAPVISVDRHALPNGPDDATELVLYVDSSRPFQQATGPDNLQRCIVGVLADVYAEQKGQDQPSEDGLLDWLDSVQPAGYAWSPTVWRWFSWTSWPPTHLAQSFSRLALAWPLTSLGTSMVEDDLVSFCSTLRTRVERMAEENAVQHPVSYTWNYTPGDALQRFQTLLKAEEHLEAPRVTLRLSRVDQDFDLTGVWEELVDLGLEWGGAEDYFTWSNHAGVKGGRGGPHLFRVYTPNAERQKGRCFPVEWIADGNDSVPSAAPTESVDSLMSALKGPKPSKDSAARGPVMRVRNLLFDFNVPLSPAPEEVLNAMLSAAHRMQASVGGQLYCSWGGDETMLDDVAVGEMQQKVAATIKQLKELGLDHGGKSALRVFEDDEL